jgi:NAD(P)-dependent dehydrogenase (short-subunit alcohol dehydrogenase family)
VETTAALAAIGGRLVIGARDATKSTELAADLALRHPKTKIMCLPLDLSSLDSVRAFVSEYRKRASEENWAPLKCLVLNAGMIAFTEQKSHEGHELCFAVSHLAHFFLATELLPELRAAAPSRVVLVSSKSHLGPHATKEVRSAEALRRHVVAPDAVAWGLKAGMRAYGSAKLCNAMMAKSMEARYAVHGVHSCSLHPGTMMGTSIARESPWAEVLMQKVVKYFTKDLDQGSSTTIACCLAPHDTLKGRFFSDCKVEKHSALVDDDEACETLWNLSDELVASFRSNI